MLLNHPYTTFASDTYCYMVLFSHMLFKTFHILTLLLISWSETCLELKESDRITGFLDFLQRPVF
jgi:hypothetical protein